MTRIVGIGPAHANKLVHQEKIKSIEELRAHPKVNQLLNKTQQLGLKYLEEFEQKIPRDEMKQMETVILREITAIDDQLKAEIVGSYRRGATASSDIDVLVTHPAGTKLSSLLHKIVDTLTNKSHFITDTISIGDSKFMGVCRLDSNKVHRRIDIRVFPSEQYHCALLFFTGNDQLNRHMRIVAQDQGYKLNEYSIQKVGSTGALSKPLPVTSEKDIFDYLHMDYKQPNERNM
jgi:DNA polymerase beta